MTNSARPSKTADVVTAARAVHLIRNKPPILVDELAYTMCSRTWKTIISSKLLSWIVIDVLLKPVTPLSMAIFTRARFFEDRIRMVADSGLEQIVILGAGYDTFALRHQDLDGKTRIFELDQPATQNEKRKRIKNNGLNEPDNVVYISSDLNEEDLFEVLIENGFDPEKPTVFSWFGVTYYLPFETVEATLRDIAEKSAPGSEVLFDYIFCESAVAPQWRKLYDDCAAFVARKGERWISDFDPNSIQDVLHGCGYPEVEHIPPEDINRRYFSEREDGLVYPELIGFCRANNS